MITHSVFFTLKHAPGSPAEKGFLERSLMLANIPGVQNYRQLRQTSSKNKFRFGFSMQFANQAAYDGYNAHPSHAAYVRDIWVPEVADFLEIDHEDLK
jgi:hypothetical protein